jgi:hypothetical protein
MPRQKMNYSNSCVYKICCNDINITDCYVGSTTNLNERRRQHKNACNNENNKSYNINVYKFIRDNGGWGNWTVVLVESYPECKSREELFRFERYHMEQLEAMLNSSVPGRTQKEYKRNNSEKIKEYHKEYVKNNVDKIKEYHKEYIKNNKEYNKEYKKEYYQNNSEKIKEYYQNNSEKFKEYRKDNKEKDKKYYQKIKEKRKEKVECEFCHSVVRKDSMSRHRKTKKCLATQ